MLKKLQQLIQSTFSEQQQQSSEIQLENLNQSESLSLILMLEIALADGDFSEHEKQFMHDELMRDYQLTSAQADAAITAAHAQVGEAPSLQHFTAPLKDLPYPEKVSLLENLWRIAYADNTLDPHEEGMLRKLADLLYISHADYIKSKLKVTEQL